MIVEVCKSDFLFFRESGVAVDIKPMAVSAYDSGLHKKKNGPLSDLLTENLSFALCDMIIATEELTI